MRRGKRGKRGQRASRGKRAIWLTIWGGISHWAALNFGSPAKFSSMCIHVLAAPHSMLARRLALACPSCFCRRPHAPLAASFACSFQNPQPLVYYFLKSIREVLHGVGADSVRVKFPIFAVNCSRFPLSFERISEKRRKMKKSEENEKPARQSDTNGRRIAVQIGGVLPVLFRRVVRVGGS